MWIHGNEALCPSVNLCILCQYQSKHAPKNDAKVPLWRKPLTLTTTFTFPPGLMGAGETIGTTIISFDLRLGLEADDEIAALTGSG